MQKFHRDQRVKHPQWGEVSFIGYLLGTEHEAEVQISEGHTETVDVANLEAVPWLGKRWLYSFTRNGGHHMLVVIRVGNPGSRALTGHLVLTKEEAAELELVARAMGAEVEVDL